jgi:hypothetical protein
MCLLVLLSGDHMDITSTTQFLRPYLSNAQLMAMNDGLRSEEKKFFIEKLLAIANTMRTMPKTYQQDGLGDQAIAYLHYFVGGCDWWITELDIEDGVSQAFGLASLGYEPELGYISIIELIRNSAELDLHWTPKTIGEITMHAIA